MNTSNNKVLIIEDDPIVALDLSLFLSEAGCDVIGIAKDNETALELMEASPAHILLCDINLQLTYTGIDIAKTLVQRFNPEVIYLTALEDISTLKAVVKSGPCGYLIKPYRSVELGVMIQLAIQRSSKSPLTKKSELLDIGGGYHYNQENGFISNGKKNYYLTKNEQKLLTYLSLHRHKIAPFEHIEHYIWTQKLVGEGSRRTLIYRLHTKLDYPIITVIQGRGCYFTHYPPKVH